jgi:hypothetical protein
MESLRLSFAAPDESYAPTVLSHPSLSRATAFPAVLEDVMASSSFRLRSSLGLVALALALGSTPAIAQTYPISHGAPFLGRSMAVKLTGLPPSAYFVLFESEVSDPVATPLGVWELDRVSMRKVWLGHANSSGVAIANLGIPLDPLLAEQPRHYQARIRFQHALSISQAAHLRLIGARAYVVSGGDAATGVNGRLTIASLVTKETVAELDLGVSYNSNDRSAQPVFDAGYSRGALVLGTSGVLFFDPFFGDQIARQSTPPLSGRLLTPPASDRVFALAPGDFAAGVPASILSFDLSTGAPLASLQLPLQPFTGQWISNLERKFAYVVGRDAPTGQLFVQRIDLSSFTDTGALPIGLPTSERVVDFTAGPRTVYLQARQEVGFCQWAGAFTRIDEGAVGASVSTTPWGDHVNSIVAAPAIGVFAALSAVSPCLPGASLGLTRMSDPTGPAHSVPGLFSDTASAVRLVRRGAWLQTWTNDWSGEELSFVDYANHVWTPSTLGPYPPQIVDIAAFDDALGERACALVREFLAGPTSSRRAKLYALDPAANMTSAITVGAQPYSLLTVPIP